MNAASGKMDDLLFPGSSMKDLMAVGDTTESRVLRHLRKLKKKGLTVKIKTNAKNKMKTVYRVVEESISDAE